MSKRLFVGGLPYSVTEEQLKDMFAKIGKVSSVTVITDKYTGQSKGFGFVEMDDDKDADKAIETLNQTQLDGRTIAVNIAKPMEAREPRNYGSQSRGGGYGGGRRPRDGGRGGNNGGFRRGGRY